MNRKKFLSLALTVALTATMGTTSFAFADTTAADTKAPTTAATTAAAAVSTEKATGIITDLGMFSPAKGTTKVEIDKITGKAKITFSVTPQARQYTKLALAEQTKSDKEKEKNAVTATVTPVTQDGKTKYASTFTFEISAADLGKQIPISMYQVFTKSTGEKIDGWHNFESQHYLTVKFTPEVVTNLTSAIYYQERTEGTDVLCEAAGRGWNSLTDAEKKEVTGFAYYLEEDEEKGGYEYFAEDTGDASKDNPLNQDKIGSYEILVGSFGTSYNDNRVATIGAIEKAIQKAVPNFSVRRGFTAQIIINHIQARDNEKIDNVEQAVERAIKNKVQVLVVQPTTLMSGAEFDELKETVQKYESKFKQVIYSAPICDTDADRAAVCEAVYKDAAVKAGFETADAAKASKDTAFVFMGHGTSHSAKQLYTQLQEKMTEQGAGNAFIGTVEGNPESTSMEAVVEAVKKAGYKKVVLRPMMVVAGDHANNDMAGEEDSWAAAFKTAGFEVSSQIIGLGELKEVQDIVVAHAKAAVKKAAVAKNTTCKLTAGTKKMTIAITAKSGMSGYQYRYAATKSGLTKASIKTTTSKKVTVKKLKSKKNYYVQVRTYKKTATGKKVYSAWSTAKKVKVK